MMKILLATSNPHKLDEIRAVFAAGGATHLELLSLRDVGADGLPEPVEDAPAFEGNALIKARYYAQRCGMLCMADDSGLEVDALGGAPGVISARYAGATGGRSVVDPANNAKLLAELGDTPVAQRTARFVCHMVLVSPGNAPAQTAKSAAPLSQRSGLAGGELPGEKLPGVLASVRGVIEGRILLPGETADPSQPHRGRGANGFGYDPLFEPTGMHKTTAELSPEEKNAISHRGDASRRMLAAIEALKIA